MQLPICTLRSRLLMQAALVAVLMPMTLRAQAVSTVHSFNGTDGQYPRYGVLTQGRDGKLYGTTQSGGGAGDGVIYKQQVGTDGNLVFHNVSGPDGSTPGGGLTLSQDGNYYGVTALGGVSNQGILFKITPGGILSVLHSFGDGDGVLPVAAPIQATDGNLYGTTEGQNPTVLPTVYRYNFSTGFSTIYTIPMYATPLTPLLQALGGDLFLTTPVWGSACGAIVRLTITGQVKSIRSFPCGGSSPTGPLGSLIQAADGFVYGTTLSGGPFNGGTIFRLDAKTGALTVLYNFGAIQDDGLNPEAGLVQGSDGNFYGNTRAGGTDNYGSIFEITPGGTYTQLYSFPVVSGVQAQFPEASLVQDTNGSFYGTTENGGTGLGSIFKLDMGLGPFITFVQATGKVGRTAQILGQGLTGTTSVTFNGVQATNFKVLSDTYLTAVVPSGATTGPVVVTTQTATLTSNKNFVVK